MEAYSTYQPQTKCSAYAKPGAKVLRGWIVPKYGGRPGRIASSCVGGSGIMYVIWNDRMFASYDQFRPKAYRSSTCRNKPLANCPTTLRHRDHMHISLNRNGGYGKTRFYAGSLPA